MTSYSSLSAYAFLERIGIWPTRRGQFEPVTDLSKPSLRVEMQPVKYPAINRQALEEDPEGNPPPNRATTLRPNPDWPDNEEAGL